MQGSNRTPMPIMTGRVRRAAAWAVLVLLLIVLIPCMGLLRAPQVLVVGCALVRDDGSCLPNPTETLRIWVDASESAQLSVLIDAHRVSASERKVQRGRLLELPPPKGASFVSVHVREGWRWRWRLIRLTQRHEPEWLTRAWSLRDNNRVEEGHKLLMDHWSDPVSEEARARMHSLAARIAFEQLKPDTEQLLRQSISASDRAGLLSDSLDDLLYLANLLSEQKFRLRETEELIRGAEQRFRASAELGPWWELQLAQLATLQGDLRRALLHMETAREFALQTYHIRAIADADQMAANVLVQLGRIKDAQRLVDEMKDLSLGPCRRLDLIKTIGRVHLRSAEAQQIGPSKPLEAARRAFLDAMEIIDPSGDTTKKCTQPRFAAEGLLQLAHVAAQEGRYEQVKEYVQAAQRELPAASVRDLADVQMTLEKTALEADAALATGDIQTARQGYEKLYKLGGPTDLYDTAWRARIGLAQVAEEESKRAESAGRADERADKLKEALLLYREAESYLDLQSQNMPLGNGLGGFLGRRSRGTALYLDLLTRTRADGQPGEDPRSQWQALHVIRHARARSLLGFLAMNRLGQLSSLQYQQYTEAIDSYRRQRNDLDGLLVRLHQSAADERKSNTVAFEQASQQSLGQLENALKILAAGSAQDPRAYTYRQVAPQEALLTCHPARQGWLCLLATADQVKLHRLSALDLEAPRSQLAASLLAPFRELLDASRIRKLKVVAYGPMREIDVHLLPFGTDGEPLWRVIPVVYALDLPTQALSAPAAAQPESQLPKRAFLLFDSEGRLPQCRASADSILASLRQAQIQAEPHAQGVAWQGSWSGQPVANHLPRAALLHKIAGAELFHDATHFNFVASEGLRSAIPFSDETGLSIGDILTLPPPGAPRYATLFGCETARSSEELGDMEGLGLAQAFLLRGAVWAVGTVRKVGDELAARLAVRFYDEFTKQPDPHAALRTAVESSGIPVADKRCSINTFNDLGAFRVYVP